MKFQKVGKHVLFERDPAIAAHPKFKLRTSSRVFLAKRRSESYSQMHWREERKRRPRHSREQMRRIQDSTGRDKSHQEFQCKVYTLKQREQWSYKTRRRRSQKFLTKTGHTGKVRRMRKVLWERIYKEGFTRNKEKRYLSLYSTESLASLYH